MNNLSAQKKQKSIIKQLKKLFSTRNPIYSIGDKVYSNITLFGKNIRIRRPKYDYLFRFVRFLNLENTLDLHKLMKKLRPKKCLTKLEVHLTEHCNLNCQGCFHFSTLAEKEFTDINVFEEDLKNLQKITNKKLDRLHLMGGEPLLHPQAIDFMRISRFYFPYTEIRFVTNGILLPVQKDEFWKACTEYNIKLQPTEYPMNIDYKKAEEKAKKYGVKFAYFNKSREIQKSIHPAIDLQGKQNFVHSYLTCGLTSCPLLKNGKIYTCSIAGNIEHFNKFFGAKLPNYEESFITLKDVKSYSELLNFLSSPIPLCAYCKPSAVTEHPYSQSKKDIKEWVLEDTIK